MSPGIENITGRTEKPEILAPAGDEGAFLAALAAGADAVYLGLKHFSARMEAENFSLASLARLTALAHEQGARVYVAMNTLVKPDECEKAGRLIYRLQRQVRADGLIVQDLAMPDLARQAGFEGGIFFSTLANVSSPGALAVAARAGAARVILPRELSIDEIRVMSEACPPRLGLEVFVQGALCYCVSGRCWWSSYMGGKSGLRGRCVQPCRRVYEPLACGKKGGKAEKSGAPARYFSCQDLELGVLARTLLGIPAICSWKIEGRKKGPHYVYHAVTAYRLLRDEPDDPAAKKEAENILAMALGRPGAHARFLPQRAMPPMAPHGQTASGLLAGKIRVEPSGKCVLKPRLDLQPGDYLRVGAEDERWHAVMPVRRDIPRGGSLILPLARHKTPKSGAPVFLIDRRGADLERILREWREKLAKIPAIPPCGSDFTPELPNAAPRRALRDMLVMREPAAGKIGPFLPALWLSGKSVEISRTLVAKYCWWLPPVVWPDEEEAVARLVRRVRRAGARHFVCNAPWQIGLFGGSEFPEADLAAGPFCNAANALAILELSRLGFRAAFASPELGGEDLLELPRNSPLPLGLVIKGSWPVGISRFGLSGLNDGDVFKSPKGEAFWCKRRGENVWIYPSWPLDLEARRKELLQAGYSFFAALEEKPPPGLDARERSGFFNWDVGLL